ncbi:MAG: A24 family peptidase [Proteocatella sp.]
MLNIEMTVFAVSGFVIGWFVPKMYQKIIEFKCSQKSSRKIPEFHRGRTYKLIFGVLNMIFYIAMIALTGDVILAISASIIITLAIIITVVDIKIRLIPNELVLILLAFGMIYRLILAGIPGTGASVAGALIMIMLFGISGKIAGFNKVGAGDIKLAFAIGIVCASTNIVPALAVMAGTMAFVSVGGMLIGKLKRTDMIPFAGFMMAGMVAGIVSSLNISTILSLF